MIRGTTPTIRLVFKYTLDFLSDYDITFSQEDDVVLVKKKDEISVDKNIMSVQLTDKETLLFDDEKLFGYQVRGKTNDGKVIATRIKYNYVYDILNEDILL